MIKDSFLVLDDREIWTEKQCRNYLKEMELNDIVNNIDDYLDDTMNIKQQLACVDTALHGEMEDVIYNLGNQWCVPIFDLTKDFIYKGVKAVFKKYDCECITIDFYDRKTNKTLDADIEIYYRGCFMNDDFITDLESFIDENLVENKEFTIVEKYKIKLYEENVIYGKLDNGNYFIIPNGNEIFMYNDNIYDDIYDIALNKTDTTNYEKIMEGSKKFICSYDLGTIRLFKKYEDDII